MKGINKKEQELDEKEFESDIEKNLRVQELEREQREKFDKEYHPVVLMAINLIGNLIIGYIFFFVTKMFLSRIFHFFPDSINDVYFLLFHLIIWVLAIIGVITKKSPWEKFLK